MFEGTVESIDDDGSATISTEIGLIHGRGLHGLEVGHAAVASIHLEDVELVTESSDAVDRANVLRGTVGIGLFNGPSVLYRVDVGGRIVEAHLGGHDAFEGGAAVHVVFPKRHVRILSRDSKAWTFADDPDQQ